MVSSSSAADASHLRSNSSSSQPQLSRKPRDEKKEDDISGVNNNNHNKQKKKQPLLPGGKGKKKSTTVVVSWMLTAALTFSLFQTFTYDPPHHLDSIDHHHPSMLLSPNEREVAKKKGAKDAKIGISIPPPEKEKETEHTIKKKKEKEKPKPKPDVDDDDGDDDDGKKTPKFRLLANQPRRRQEHEQQQIFGPDYPHQEEILWKLKQQLPPGQVGGALPVNITQKQLELKNQRLPLLGGGDELLREPRRLVNVLKEANLFKELSSDERKSLPDLEKTFDNLYGPFGGNNSTRVGGTPIIYGLETCEMYRKMVPWRERFMAPAGMFNTGTNNIETTLKNNLDFLGRSKYQVPWGKHRMLEERGINHAVVVGMLDHTKVLPIVIVRDPYHWMQSMCKTQYAARWAHGARRCPNLVRTKEDEKRFKAPTWDAKQLHHKEKGVTTFQVKVRFSEGNIHYYDSMVDLWNDFYRPYWDNEENIPRLIVRFEDMLLHAPLVVDQIAKCMGITHKPRFKYIVDSAKKHGSHTTFLQALMKTVDTKRREHGLNLKDKIYAAQHLDPEMMHAFQYRPAEK